MARITVEYTSTPLLLYNQKFEGNAEWITLDIAKIVAAHPSATKLVFDGSTQALSIQDAPNFLMRSVDWVYTFNKVSEYDIEEWFGEGINYDDDMGTDGLIGKVNSNDVQIEPGVIYPNRGYKFKATTLLFNPPQAVMESQWNLAVDARPIGFRTTFRMSYRPAGWQKLYDPGKQKYLKLALLDDQDQNVGFYKPYAEAIFDVDKLFPPPKSSPDGRNAPPATPKNNPPPPP